MVYTSRYIIQLSMEFLVDIVRNLEFQKFQYMDLGILMRLFCYMQGCQLEVWLEGWDMQV